MRFSVIEKTPRMLLLSCPRNGRQRRASLLLLAVVVVCAVPVSTSLPAHKRCPSPIDCAEEGRERCKLGSNRCGPCFDPLVENEDGMCVARRKHHQYGKASFHPVLDEEIDYLQGIIEKQVVSENKPQKQRKNPAAAASQSDAKNSNTDVSRGKQKNQDPVSNKTVPLVGAAPPALTTAEKPTPLPGATQGDDRGGPVVVQSSKHDGFLLILISLFVAVGAIGLVMATVCLVKLKKESRMAQKVDYPAFKGSGPPATAANGSSMGDKTLAQSAQMYHYQHQKQQMLSVGNQKPEQKTTDTEITSDEEEVGGDFTVYECPGLAPTGEMEVKNPLFDDSTLQYQGNPK
ncbi:neural proliferation differentiation and control protein 1-like [Xyrichtys novacula]|uniref:Neural proliferation differentiation and control protein 1-like n=1 Tax=Xyrichtys novacula TaxID=13765 RepID=A0AAV1GCJ6_XYRNO|nr:neural proliferation differentiation and control protein 1-like [Xyrichtys novacula]